MKFYLRYAAFHLKEPFTSVANSVGQLLLFPLFIWTLGQVWRRFNGPMGTFTYEEVIAYVGVAEVLFMSFLRSSVILPAIGDFSLTLARPRPWLAVEATRSLALSFSQRLVYLLFLIPFLAVEGWDASRILTLSGRLLILLPLLGIAQTATQLTLACATLRWSETRYLILPISKVFLAFGGVFGPLTDYSPEWRDRILALPPADLFFQPAYFCVRGEFFQMSGLDWLARVLFYCVAVSALNGLLYRSARRHHLAWGG